MSEVKIWMEDTVRLKDYDKKFPSNYFILLRIYFTINRRKKTDQQKKERKKERN